MNGKNYTKDWASGNYKIWKEVLRPIIGSQASILEIGSYEGRSAIWFLENILTHPDSRIVCIDPWDQLGNNYELDYDLSAVKEAFMENTKEFHEKILIMQGFSFQVLCKINTGEVFDEPHLFDVIYIDGDHRTHSILQDCVLSWPLLRDGGLMIFDDYSAAGKDSTITNYPKLAIDNFLQTIPGEFEAMFYSYQLIVQKKRK